MADEDPRKLCARSIEVLQEKVIQQRRSLTREAIMACLTWCQQKLGFVLILKNATRMALLYTDSFKPGKSFHRSADDVEEISDNNDTDKVSIFIFNGVQTGSLDERTGPSCDMLIERD